LLVVDASALAEALLLTTAGELVMQTLNGELHAPELVVAECLSVLRGWGLGGHAPWLRLVEAVDDLLAMPLILWPMSPLVPRAWTLGHNLSSYDALYVTLAETLGAPLVTCDGRLARGAPSEVEIRLIQSSDA
jgi:predicted nucleic acid-binding protein